MGIVSISSLEANSSGELFVFYMVVSGEVGLFPWNWNVVDSVGAHRTLSDLQQSLSFSF